jgi:hypothetical protein
MACRQNACFAPVEPRHDWKFRPTSPFLVAVSERRPRYNNGKMNLLLHHGWSFYQRMEHVPCEPSKLIFVEGGYLS